MIHAGTAIDELDKELESRGQGFVRYGDDGNLYVKTPRDGERRSFHHRAAEVEGE